MTEGFNIQRDEKTDSRHNLTWHMMEINRQKREKQMQQMVDRINEQDADLKQLGVAFDNFYLESSHLDERIVRCRKVYDSKCTGEASVCDGKKNDAFGWR